MLCAEACLVIWRHVIIVVCFVIQEEKYTKYVDGLRLMLDRYHSVLGSLNVAEVRTW